MINEQFINFGVTDNILAKKITASENPLYYYKNVSR